MKIIYLSATEFPSREANSVNTFRMCAAFAANGHQVCLMFPSSKPKDGSLSSIFEFYGVEPSFDIQPIEVPIIRGRGYLSAWKMGAAVKRAKPDLVYARFYRGAHAALLRGNWVVFEAHEPIAAEGAIQAAAFRAFIGSRRCLRVVAISRALTEDYIARYPRERRKIIMAHDAADGPGAFQQVSEKRNGRFRAVYVGSLFPGKGMETISQVAALCPWADFEIIGGTPQLIDQWKNQCRHLFNVQFHGFVPPSEAGKWQSMADALLAPYQRKVHSLRSTDIARWMSPLKIFEYMASGRPIVASDLPALREILVPGEECLMFPPEDPQAWKTGLEQLRDNPAFGERLGGKALSKWERQHTWKARARLVLGGLN